jgi:hypothetical protein
MKITLKEDFGLKTKGTSFNVSTPTAIALISKGVAVRFGEKEPKKEKVKEVKTEK